LRATSFIFTQISSSNYLAMVIYKSVNKGSQDWRNLTAKLKNKEISIISQVHEFI
jgi:hypothetical protein